MFKKVAFLYFVFIFPSFFGQSLKAGHYTAGEIFYEWIGNEPGKGPLDYRVYATLYRNTAGAISPKANLTGCAFTDSASTGLTLSYIPPNAPFKPAYLKWWKDTGPDPRDPDGWLVETSGCNSSIPVIAEYRYAGEVTLSKKASNWTFAIDLPCCRSLNDNFVFSTYDFYLEAKLNNLKGPNSSPRITSSGVLDFCVTDVTQPKAIWQQATQEFDGDQISIDFSSVGSLTGDCPGGFRAVRSILLDSNYTYSRPLPVRGPIQINHQKGIFKMRPSQAGIYVVKLEVSESRYDSASSGRYKVGNTTREVLIRVSASCDTQAFKAPGICMVSFDPKSKLNMVSLRKNYRHSDSIFLHQGQTIKKVLSKNARGRSFFDSALAGIGRPYKCRVSAFSKCGFYTDTSVIHENMRLSAKVIDSGRVQLTWTPYRGRSISAYRIYEVDSSFNKVRQVGQVAANVYSFQLPNLDSTTAYFMVEGVLNDPSCLETSFAYDGPLSATGLFGIGLNEHHWSAVSVFPNPTEGLLKIDWPYPDNSAFQVHNVQGQRVAQGYLKPHQNRIDIGRLPTGLYFLRINGISGSKRIVKQ